MKKRKKRIFISAGVLFSLIATTLLYQFYFAKKAEAAWWDETWRYRKVISIPTHSTAETNVYVTVPTFDATDTTKFQDDCGDLRFTNVSGDILPYYVVSCSANSVVHVFFDSLPAGASTYYMYYGNYTAVNGFSGSDFTTAATGLGTLALGSEELSPAPVAYWKFDEGYGTVANDSTSGKNNGTITGATWQSEDKCISGKCLSISGTSSYMTTTGINNLNSQGFTISGWINVQSQPSYYASMLASSTGGFMVYFTNGGDSQMNAYAQIYNGTAWTPVSCTTKSKFHTWYLLSLVYDASTQKAKVYLNGSLCSSEITIPGGININYTKTLRIGEYAGYQHDNLIDEVKVYAYPRTSDQIKSDYSSRGSTKGVSVQMGSSNQNSDAFSSGLVGYWKMDEASGSGTLLDSSGTGNSGTWNGTGIHNTPGKFASGGNFNGTDDYIIVNNSASLNTTNVTVSFWIKTTSLGSDKVLLSKGTNYSDQSYWFYENSGIRFGMNSASTSTIPVASITNNAWHYIVGTYDGTYIRIYLDGLLYGNPVAASPVSNTANLGINSYGGGDYIAGSKQLDEVRVYNRALSAGEVADLYNWAPGPAAYYPFDEGIGTIAYDKANNRQATLQNGASWATGKYGKAVKLNVETNSNQYLTVSSSVTHNNSFTKEAWIKPTSIADCVESRCSIIYPYFEIAGTALQFYSYQLTTPGWHTGGTIKLNQWQHVAVSFDGAYIRLYIDGVQIYGLADTQTANIAASGLIGAFSSNSRTFKGYIDEVKIYDYARTTKQIVEDMNAGHPVPGSPVGSQLLYYKFDEGTGSTAYNSGNGGSSLDANIYNTAWSNDGHNGKSLNFNGSSSYARLNTPILSGKTNLTVSVWLKLASLGNHDTVVGEYSPGAIFGLMANGSFKFYNGINYYSTATPITSGTWQHLAYVFDGNSGTIKFYRNGVFVEQISNVGSSLVNSTVNTEIGARSNGTVDQINGLFDELKIYNSALTADEIKIDYNRGTSMTMGSTSTTSSGAPDNSSSGTYCIPGDTSPCSAPVGEWNFEEGSGSTANDSSLSNKNLPFVSGIGSPAYQSGKIGKSLYFDGTDGVGSNDGGSVAAITGPVTVNAWVKTNATTSGGIVCRYGNNSSWTFCVYMSADGKVHFLRSSATDAWSTDLASINSINDNRWHYISARFDSSTMKIYIDGTENNSVAETRTSQPALWSFCIGNQHYLCDETGYNGHFKGYIDQVRIYNYARTPAQIAWDYNRGAPVGWWKFDECQGNTANDSSGNGNTGTINIGASGTQSSAGTCTTSGTAWENGATGKYNSSLNFDGNDDYANLGDINQIEGIEEVSISFWAKHNTDIYKSWEAMITKGDTSGSFRIHMSGNKIQWVVQTENGYTANTSNFTPTQGKWFYVTAVYKNGSQILYINGQPNNTVSHSGTIVNSTYYLSVANNSQVSGRNWDGQIDDVRVYNYALTPTQIKTLFNNGAVNFGPVTGQP